MMTMTSYGDDEDEDPQRRGPFRPPSLWPREAGRSAPGNNVYGARARTGTRTADLGQDSDSAAWGARGDRRRRCALPQAHEAVRRHGHAVSLSLSLSLSPPSLSLSLPPSLGPRDGQAGRQRAAELIVGSESRALRTLAKRMARDGGEVRGCALLGKNSLGLIAPDDYRCLRAGFSRGVRRLTGACIAEAGKAPKQHAAAAAAATAASQPRACWSRPV